MEFISSSSLSGFEFFPQILDNCLVRCFSLSISLGVPLCGEAKLHFTALTEFPEVARNELGSIISDDLLGYAKPANDILPDETLDVQILNISMRFCFDPFREVISEYKKVLALTTRPW